MAKGNAEGCRMIEVSVVEALVIIKYCVLVVRSGYTGNMVI